MAEDKSDICCLYHLMVSNAFNQLASALEVTEALQYDGEEIPIELLQKMFKVVHLGGIRCRYDSCGKEKNDSDGIPMS